MPRFYTDKRKLRKSTPISGHEVTMPPAWIRTLQSKGNLSESVELLYDSIVVIVPRGVRVNEKILAAAVEEDFEDVKFRRKQEKNEAGKD